MEVRGYTVGIGLISFLLAPVPNYLFHNEPCVSLLKATFHYSFCESSLWYVVIDNSSIMGQSTHTSAELHLNDRHPKFVCLPPRRSSVTAPTAPYERQQQWTLAVPKRLEASSIDRVHSLESDFSSTSYCIHPQCQCSEVGRFPKPSIQCFHPSDNPKSQQ